VLANTFLYPFDSLSLVSNSPSTLCSCRLKTAHQETYKWRSQTIHYSQLAVHSASAHASKIRSYTAFSLALVDTRYRRCSECLVQILFRGDEWPRNNTEV
jgi:hypothetical protein